MPHSSRHHIDELLAESDLDGRAVWYRILEVVAMLAKYRSRSPAARGAGCVQVSLSPLIVRFVRF
jgi:hypothetical protein